MTEVPHYDHVNPITVHDILWSWSQRHISTDEASKMLSLEPNENIYEIAKCNDVPFPDGTGAENRLRGIAMAEYKYVYDRKNPRTLWDALNGWSEGTLSWKEAIRIGGLEDRFDLITAAIDHGVPFPGKLSPEEESQADEFTKVLRSFAA